MASFDPQQSFILANLLARCIGLQDFARLVHLCHYLLQVQHLEGAVVEFGCHVGHTTKLMTALCSNDVYVYDSFEGLPPDSQHPGAMKASVEDFLRNFNVGGLRRPTIVRGWFDRIPPQQVPHRIIFAHLDGDLYDSTLYPLRLVYEKMVPGGVILIDDYGAEMWPGVKKACDEFFVDKPEKVVALRSIDGKPAEKGLVVKL